MYEFCTSVLAFVVLLPYFWLIFAGIAILTSVFVVKENGFYSGVSTLILLVLLAAKWEAIALNPVFAAVAVLAYLAVGLLWSRYQWARLLSKKFEFFQQIRDEFLMKSMLPLDYFKTYDAAAEVASLEAVPNTPMGVHTSKKEKASDELTTLGRYVHHVTKLVGKNNVGYIDEITTVQQFHAALAPKASDNKGSIVMWITYWPVSSLWYVLKDIIADLNRFIYNLVAGRFQRMAAEKFNQL